MVVFLYFTPPWYETIRGVRRPSKQSEARRGRKMGHVTCVAPTLVEAVARANRVAAALGIEGAR